ncbi:MAG: metal-dependent hydrolase, partial [Gammaproteobacteria bacterium]|nr:metal-dependent hydrolase [Gammaproteobacteria bacterium]
ARIIMDPVAHTLVGAVLAETGLKRVSSYATATLLIGVNLPDIDGIAKFWGHDASLYFRRGWSHGIVAMVVLPLVLAALIWLWSRWRNRTTTDRPAFQLRWIILLAFLAVWTHPLLDWMNTYGVRLLMPFDERWFYGDTLFIIDPWIWLVLAAGILLARRTSYRELAFWSVLAMLSSWLILNSEYANLWIQTTWFGGLALIVALRIYRPGNDPAPTFARAGIGIVIIYICTMYGVARITEDMTTERYQAPLQSQANPLPGLAFSHRVILVYDEYYRIIGPQGKSYEVPREKPNQIVKMAMQSESIRGFINWMRFPYWEVEPIADGWRVKFMDLRYQGPESLGASLGFAEVVVPYKKEALE